ncbi:MAG: OmpA family protein [Woeseiaceae bacterium]|nr:OmpA family protein [Woeseiaceae bacterium]
MNTSTHNLFRFTGFPVATLAILMLVAGCATAPTNPAGSAEVRSKMDRLQSNTTLADLAPVEIREAETSVELAEQPVGKDVALGEYRVYMADRKVEIAMAKASTRYAEEQRMGLSQARDDARLDARTREADMAHRQTAMAESETAAARSSAVVAAADAASRAADAARDAEKLQRQIDELKAEATDRGLVLTLGNTLFATGRSDLKLAGQTSLDKLVVFLNEYPDRSVAIEGHTDDVGSLEMNQTLSQHRADSVRSYLTQQGIQSRRLTAAGMGETQPIADNLSESGRQQNRRVEVVIDNPPIAIPTASTN